MPVVEEKDIAKVTIEQEGSEGVSDELEEKKKFVDEHRELKVIIDSHGGCVTLDTLIAESGLTEDRLELHTTMFTDDDTVAQIVENAICSRTAIKDLSKRLGSEA